MSGTDLSGMVSLAPAPGLPYRRRAPHGTRGPVLAGAAVMAVFFGGFGAFAGLAPLAGAVVAPGVVKVEGNRQAVQHPDGGVVRELMVHEGDHVEKGQVLLQLDPVAPRARLDTLQIERDALRAQEARFIAERDGADGPKFEALADRAGTPSADEAVRNQSALFRERKRQFEAQIAVRRQRIVQLGEQIKGYRVEIAGLDRQQALIDDELAGIRDLFAKGFVPKTRLVSLERTAAQITADRGSKLAAVASTDERIGETRLAIVAAERDRTTEIVDGLRETQARLGEIGPKLIDARAVLERTTVRAPSEGAVVALTAFTVGGVIAAGSHVLDVVPSQRALIVEAQIPPENVDEVAAGMAAEVRLTGIAQKRRPIAAARVATVSADRLDDPGGTGTGHYTAQVRFDDAAGLRARDIVLQPGMPAQVIVTTRNRTMLDYLIAPLSDQVERVFREE